MEKYTKLSRIQSNKFPILFLPHEISLVFEVEITSKALSLNVLPKDQLGRLILIKKLHSDGLSDNEIAHFLNSKNIKTPKGKRYYQELVWVTRNKFEKRNLRKEEFSYEIRNVNFLVTA